MEPVKIPPSALRAAISLAKGRLSNAIQGSLSPGSLFIYVDVHEKTDLLSQVGLLELMTGFEPVTSSLPRMRSTC